MHPHYRSNAQIDSLAQLVEHIPFKDGVLGSNPRRITEQIGKMPQIAETKTVSAIFVIPLSSRIVNIVRCGGVQFVNSLNREQFVHDGIPSNHNFLIFCIFRVSGFFRCMAIFQANSLHSLNMKKRGSDTPLNWVRNILILALKDSAEAFVARDLK